MMPSQMGIQVTAGDRVGINPLVDSFVVDTHQLVVGVVNNQSAGDFLRRPVIHEFALNIV